MRSVCTNLSGSAPGFDFRARQSILVFGTIRAGPLPAYAGRLMWELSSGVETANAARPVAGLSSQVVCTRDQTRQWL